MSDAFRLGKSVVNLTSSPQFDGYSKVVITVTDDLSYSAGTDTGRVLSLSCPWGTQKMANDILSSIKGYKYQPYTAKGAILDPAAELGDGVTIQNVYGGIYSRDIRFGGLCSSDISAPEDEEIDHEYPYVPKQERKVNRQLKGLTKSYSELKIAADKISASVTSQGKEIGAMRGEIDLQADEIAAKVSKSGGSAQSFGWVLDSESWTLKSNGTDVLKVDKSGLNVTGIITATGGKIGGFTIKGDSLSSNGQVWTGEKVTQGVYIGPEGIQLGKNFRVDNQGNLEAASGKFTGDVYASSIKYGKSSDGKTDYGTIPGGALTDGAVSTTKLSGGVNTSLGYANFSNNVFNGKSVAGYVYGQKVQATQTFQFKNYTASIGGLNFVDGEGKTHSINYLKMSKL